MPAGMQGCVGEIELELTMEIIEKRGQSSRNIVKSETVL